MRSTVSWGENPPGGLWRAIKNSNVRIKAVSEQLVVRPVIKVLQWLELTATYLEDLKQASSQETSAVNDMLSDNLNDSWGQRVISTQSSKVTELRVKLARLLSPGKQEVLEYLPVNASGMVKSIDFVSEIHLFSSYLAYTDS